MGRRGFTLSEVLVVMALVAAALTLILPMWQRTLADLRLYMAARQMAVEIRYCQQLALAAADTGLIYKMVFVPDYERYYRVLNTRVQQQVQLTFPLDIIGTTFNNNEVTFTARGVPLQGGTILLGEKISGKRYYVILAPVTGRVRLSRTSPDSW